MLGSRIKANWKWSNRRWQEWTWTFKESTNWNGLEWVKLNSDDHYIYYCRQESLRRNGVAITVKKDRNAVLGCNLKNDRMISVRFQGKAFNITVIQVYAPTSNAEEAEVERFSEDLQDLLESEVAQLCPTLCDPMDWSPQGLSVHGIVQARILEWVAISFSRGSSWLRDWTWVSHIAGRRFMVWATREAFKTF